MRRGEQVALFDIGRAIFTWLDEAGWATEWIKGSGRRGLEIAVEETDSSAAIALLDLPWELLVYQTGFLASDAAQPFVLFRSINRPRDASPQMPEHRDLALMFYMFNVV